MPHAPAGSRSRARALLAPATAAIAGALAAAVLAACGASDGPPPRSPLDDGGSPPPASTATGTFPTAIPTGPSTGTPAATATGVPSNGGSTEDPPADPEQAAARAIDLMAEYLGVPATALTIESSEEVQWSDACLGVYHPGSACADVLTPGYRIVLRDAYFNLHTLHGDTEGRFTWAGEEEASGLVASVDASAGLVTIESADGESTFRRVPGSRILRDGTVADLERGIAVVVAYDRSPSGGEMPVIAWLMAEP